MRFHIVMLPNYVEGVDPPFDVYYRELLEQIELAEELGFECFWFTEHHLMRYGGPCPNPASLIAVAAARTSKMRLGCSVSVIPLRHPVHIAEDYAVADAISGGRLEFGMGVGNNPREYQVFGVPFEEGRERFDEATEVILGLWGQERFSHKGRFWDFEDVTIYPRPVQQPHPPIWIAGLSEASLSRAGRNGHNIMTVAHARRPEETRPGVTAWRKNLAEAGYAPSERQCLIHLRGYVGEESKRAQQVGQEAIACYTELSALGLNRPTSPDQLDWEKMLQQGRNVYGNPDQCIEALRHTTEHFDFDICGMQFSFGGLPHAEVVKSMRLFAREVLPAFR
jgi:probable F420-dependent oxidoreductase